MRRSGPGYSKCQNPGELSCQVHTYRMNRKVAVEGRRGAGEGGLREVRGTGTGPGAGGFVLRNPVGIGCGAGSRLEPGDGASRLERGPRAFVDDEQREGAVGTAGGISAEQPVVWRILEVTIDSMWFDLA